MAKRHFHSFLKLLSLITAASMLSCSPVIRSSKITALSTNYCAPTIQYSLDPGIEQDSLPVASITSRLSSHDARVAAHVGIVPLLSHYSDATSAEQKIAARQRIMEKLILFQTETEAVAAELDCNGERFDQLSRFLNILNSRQTNQLTVASIVVGAAITLSTAIIKNDNLNKGINIGGGLAGAGLGFTLLSPKGKKVQLKPSRSLLKNIWTESNADNAFPAALWKVMTDKSFSNDGQLSLVQTLRKRWEIFIFNQEVHTDTEQRFFETGGNYSEEDFQHLADMTNELQASVRTVQQDLRSLVSTINQLP
jgi:hypothetical protein